VTPLVGVSTGELASAQRGPETAEARELLGALAVERRQIGVKALADALGRSRNGISKWARRAALRRQHDRGFAARLDDLDRRLAADLDHAAS
jgi:hypothetical protein